MTSTAGRRSAHSLSFGAHYDPDDVSFGLIVAHNDDELDPFAGYDDHRHRDVEIVTWVVRGTLLHEHVGADGGRLRRQLPEGSAQVLSAGGGVEHAEHAEGSGARFVQVWLSGDRGSPRYQAAAVDMSSTGWSPVAGRAASPLTLRSSASLSVARIEAGGTIVLPGVALGHLFVVDGAIELAGDRLGAGDAARLRDTTPLGVNAVAATQLLLWDLT